MPRSPKSDNGHDEVAQPHRDATSSTSEQQDATGPIEQAQALKASLRDALSKTSELIASLKRHRKRSKLVESTLASLRELQTVDK